MKILPNCGLYILYEIWPRAKVIKRPTIIIEALGLKRYGHRNISKKYCQEIFSTRTFDFLIEYSTNFCKKILLKFLEISVSVEFSPQEVSPSFTPASVISIWSMIHIFNLWKWGLWAIPAKTYPIIDFIDFSSINVGFF